MRGVRRRRPDQPGTDQELVERVPGVKGAVMINGISAELLEQTLEILRMHPSF